MSKSKKRRSRLCKSYYVVKEGTSVKRPAPPRITKRESQENEVPSGNYEEHRHLESAEIRLRDFERL